MKILKRITVCAALLSLLFTAFAYAVGSSIMAPRPAPAGSPPEDLRAESVAIPSASGSILSGWFIQGNPGSGAVVLLHGVRASRHAMIGRARFFARNGYSVLLFDFQAHGESPGTHITFGYLEARDASAAVAWVRERLPGERVAAVGTSLGGAASLLADPPLDVDALVVEAAYPTIQEALDDRIALRLGRWATLFSPVLTVQLRPRLGIGVEDLRPIDRAGSLATPKLFLAGSADQHTRLDESRALFERASEPKELWIVDGAGHVDLHAFARLDYETRVGAFLAARLRP